MINCKLAIEEFGCGRGSGVSGDGDVSWYLEAWTTGRWRVVANEGIDETARKIAKCESWFRECILRLSVTGLIKMSIGE